MAEINIRPMDKADLQVVVRIEADCQSHPWSLLQFLEGFNAGHQGWVVCQQIEGSELIVGFAIVAVVLDESSLLNICIKPSCQRQGIGSSLLAYVMNQARAANMAKMFLEVRASNRSAIALYEKTGFSQVAVRRDYYPAIVGREDGLVYSLSFSSDASGDASRGA